jgi:sRNA-binding regulator protein Hfq
VLEELKDGDTACFLVTGETLRGKLIGFDSRVIMLDCVIGRAHVACVVYKSAIACVRQTMPIDEVNPGCAQGGAVDIGDRLEPLEREAAKARQSTQNNAETASVKFSEANSGNALDKVAAAGELTHWQNVSHGRR